METSEKLKIENELDDQEENYPKKEYPENIDEALLDSDKKYDD